MSSLKKEARSGVLSRTRITYTKIICDISAEGRLHISVRIHFKVSAVESFPFLLSAKGNLGSCLACVKASVSRLVHNTNQWAGGVVRAFFGLKHSSHLHSHVGNTSQNVHRRSVKGGFWSYSGGRGVKLMVRDVAVGRVPLVPGGAATAAAH